MLFPPRLPPQALPPGLRKQRRHELRVSGDCGRFRKGRRLLFSARHLRRGGSRPRPLDPEVFAHCPQLPLVQRLTARGLDELRQDRSALKVRRSIAVIEFIEGADSQVRCPIGRAAPQVESEDINQIEHRVLEVSSVQLLGDDRIEERLRLFDVAERFEESGRKKGGAQSGARPIVERPHALRLVKGVQSLLHPVKGYEAVGADALHPRSQARISIRGIPACSVKEIECSLWLVVRDAVGHDDEGASDLRPVAAPGIRPPTLFQRGRGFIPSPLVTVERASDREPTGLNTFVARARSAVLIGPQERGMRVLPLAPDPPGVRRFDPDHRQAIVLERCAALGWIYPLYGKHRQVRERLGFLSGMRRAPQRVEQRIEEREGVAGARPDHPLLLRPTGEAPERGQFCPRQEAVDGRGSLEGGGFEKAAERDLA